MSASPNSFPSRSGFTPGKPATYAPRSWRTPTFAEGQSAPRARAAEGPTAAPDPNDETQDLSAEEVNAFGAGDPAERAAVVIGSPRLGEGRRRFA